jgi:hypothetical protein
MIRIWRALVVGGFVLAVLGRAEAQLPTFETVQLCDQFTSEGAYYADFNRDGHLDVVSGPFWYQGPDFKIRHEIRTPQTFKPESYSDNFLTFTADFNGNGWPDVFYVPFPGKEGYWYENPAGRDVPWKRHLALESVENESPMWGDVNGNGRPDLVFNTGGRLGYATWDPERPYEPWKFHPVSPPGDYHRFTHGVGFGDIDGDGRIDVLEKDGWWQQPADPKEGDPWTFHTFKFGEAPAQMLVYDVNGNGLNDVITAWHSHHYGLVWYEQQRDDSGGIHWKQHVILTPTPDVNSEDLRISQLHALELADIDGDGLMDVVTGKRFWAHGPKGDPEPDAPAVVYWFQLVRDEQQVRYVPHLIHDDSGVGTQVAAADLNGDGIPDIIVGNKKGTFLHLSRTGR